MEKGLLTGARRDWAVALGISLLSALPFLLAGVSRTFLGIDDPMFVTANPAVLEGLSAAGARWAFTTTHFYSWFPLTWLSHMLDVTLFGLDARGHHATNILLHALNAGLLFLALRRMTGALWRSALVAALFGVHPLHVESVAWIAARKDVLSGLFFMLVLLAWERYARLGGARRYLAALALFALGLMAKSMLVTLPFVLLLLDVWPLGRTPLSRGDHPRPTGWGSLLLEKIPFLALAAASGVVTSLAQPTEFAPHMDIVPPGERLANGIVSYAAYLAETLWPARLAVFYPYPASIPWLAVAASALLLALLSLAALQRLRSQPYLAVGWCWFVGMLVPVIGFVQVGGMARADRWTYLPLIGVFIAVVWLAAEKLPPALRRPKVMAPLAAALVAACVAAGAVQASYWRDSETLFRRALAVTEDNWLIQNSLAGLLTESGRHKEALSRSLEAVRLKPNFADAHYHLGNALAGLGRFSEAAGEYREAIRLRPDYVEARYNLGNALASLGRSLEAAGEYREAIRIKPDSAEAHYNLGNSLARLGRFAEAAQSYREAVRIDPDSADAHYSLGNALAALGRDEEAEAGFREALRIDPDHAEARAGLSRLAQRRGAP